MKNKNATSRAENEYTMLNSMELSNAKLSGIKCVERFEVLIGSRLTNRTSD
jgi:hypothetical protein